MITEENKIITYDMSINDIFTNQDTTIDLFSNAEKNINKPPRRLFNTFQNLSKNVKLEAESDITIKAV
jgi:hypothetical protein